MLSVRAAPTWTPARLRATVAIAAALIAVVMMIGVGMWGAEPDSAHYTDLTAVGTPVATLPLTLSTGSADQVITVVASAPNAPIAVLQAWARVPGGWQRMGPSVTAHTASGGLTATPHEGLPATPLGSFALTQAFGKRPNPGTTMPFFQLADGDWWISQPGPLYNTHQLCTVSCPFKLGGVNTHLEDPIRAYNYVLAIDYNRYPVVQGAGSAYFLHVTTAGKPTRGCIAIPQPAMIALLRWARPSASPRILIGIAK